MGKIARQHRNVISLCHTVAKELRKQSTQNAYKEHGESYKIPRLDVKTRWGSTFMMVHSPGVIFDIQDVNYEVILHFRLPMLLVVKMQ